MLDPSTLNVLIRGAGGMASGIAVRLLRAGIGRICLLEQPRPRAVQRLASFSDAVYEGFAVVEGVTAALVSHPRELPSLWSAGCMGVLVDPAARFLQRMRPTVCIDATGDRNMVFSLADAPLVIGLRPLHQPGVHAHAVIETSGPRLGRVLYGASPVTHASFESGDVNVSTGYSVHAPRAGMFRTGRDIGEHVQAGERIGSLHPAGSSASRRTPMDDEGVHIVKAPVSGTLRGILRDYTPVDEYNRLARIDPRPGVSCHQVSDRVLAVGGGVLEAVMHALHPKAQPRGGMLIGKTR
jgi:Shikimate 5-dehydrogenase